MISDFETIVKSFITVTGLITVIVKMTDSFSETRIKRNLKADLELLEKINKEGLDDIDKEKIRSQTKIVLEEYLKIKNTAFKWFDVFYALTLFIGFGWWTVFIYELSLGFNPWTILTGLISFIGLGLLIDGKWSKKSDKTAIIEIIIYKSISTAIITLGMSIFIGLYLYSKYHSYSNWFILIGAIFILGIKILYDSIKVKK